MSKYLISDTDLEVTCNGNSQSCFFFFNERKKSNFWNTYPNLYSHSAYMNLKKCSGWDKTVCKILIIKSNGYLQREMLLVCFGFCVCLFVLAF